MKNIIKKINWKKCNDLIPAIIQDKNNGVILMLGYMNKVALKKTLRSKQVWFYSRTRKKIWMKGETSGNILKVFEIKIDCDNDTLLVKVEPYGPTCHTGIYSCFEERKSKDNLLAELFRMIESRKEQMPKGSYSTSLFKAGLDKISLKVLEESLEVVHAVQKQTKQRVIEETVDLVYHLFVLLVEEKINMDEIDNEIKRRQKK